MMPVDAAQVVGSAPAAIAAKLLAGMPAEVAGGLMVGRRIT